MVVSLFDADKLCDAGYRFHTRSKLDLAIRAYSQALREDPHNLQALMSRAYAYHEQFRNAEAVEDISRAILLDPDDSHLYILRGEFRMWIGKHKEAGEDFTKALEFNPEDGRALYLLGRTMEGRRQYGKAIECYQQALACGTDREREVYLGIGLCSMLQGRYDQVEQYILKARGGVVKPSVLEAAGDRQPLRVLISTGQQEYDERLAREMQAYFEGRQSVEFVFSANVGEIIALLAGSKFDLFCCLINNLIFAPDNDPWEKLHLLRYIKKQYEVPIVSFYFYPATGHYKYDLLLAGSDFAFVEPVRFKEEVLPLLAHFLETRGGDTDGIKRDPGEVEKEWRSVAAGNGPVWSAELDRLIARQPENSYLYFCRGHARLHRAESEAAINNQPDQSKHIDLLLRIAVIFDQAVADFQRARELGAEHGELVREAIFRARRGKYDLAAH